MPGLDSFWAGYEATLARIRSESPGTTEGVTAILNAFQAPSVGVAFFGNNADDHLSQALMDSGWQVRFIEGDYLWEAHHPVTGDWLHYVEGDVYEGRYRAPRRYDSQAEAWGCSFTDAGAGLHQPGKDAAPAGGDS